MKSLDTNVLLRAVLWDDERQSETANRYLGGRAYLTVTVLLETQWVLRKLERRARVDVVTSLRDIVALPNLTVAHRDAVMWALDRYAEGADFADMIHLALSGASDGFVTFDVDIARHADASVVPVETL